MQLTPHFSLEELTVTEHRDIDNSAPDDVAARLVMTAQGLERIRSLAGKAIVVSSGYRCPELNAAVGGAKNSQHMTGEAADINAIGMKPAELAALVYAHRVDLAIDQVILEFGRWVHVSFTDRPRHAALTIRSKAEGYLTGIVA